MTGNDRYVHNVVNNTNPNRHYTEFDLELVKKDNEEGLCPDHVVEFVQSKVEPIHIDAFDLAKKIESEWRVVLMQSIASGAMSSKDIKKIKVYIKDEKGDYRQIKDAYNHHNLGIVLEL